jgi:salicylate hydroxylase
MSTSPLRVAVVGGGIGGAATANALLQRGIEVRLYEQAAALTEVGASRSNRTVSECFGGSASETS